MVTFIELWVYSYSHPASSRLDSAGNRILNTQTGLRNYDTEGMNMDELYVVLYINHGRGSLQS